jgi:hypothetical protein
MNEEEEERRARRRTGADMTDHGAWKARWRDYTMAPPEDPEQRRLWELGCKGKYRYATRRGAKSAVREIRRRDGKVHDYLCGFCGYFHTGHPSPAMPGQDRYSDWHAPADRIFAYEEYDPAEG